MFYRIRQVDLDGSHSYSVIRLIRLIQVNEESEQVLHIIPNPSSADPQLYSSVPVHEITVIEAAGTVLFHAIFDTDDIRKVLLPLKDQGMYIVNVRSFDRYYSVKAVIR